MKKVKRRFKFRLLGYALIIFLGYQISFNIFMNFRLVTSNESFIKALLIDSNYPMLYEKKANNLFSKIFSKIIDVNEPITILDNIFPLKQNKINADMAYVSNPNIEIKEEKNPEIFLYNTHQGEAYEGNALEGYNITPGVMMASYIMQKRLNDQNIKAIVMEENITDYLNLNNMKYSKSYEASRKFLKEAINTNQDLKLIIDIHRDSISKEKSTVIIGDKSCAKILFVIGKEYSTYQENLQMTERLNNKIKEKYPTLTRGVIIKGGKGNNGIYNQDLKSNITLMEIGGEKNTIDEVLNTIDLISPIIGEYINES